MHTFALCLACALCGDYANEQIACLKMAARKCMADTSASNPVVPRV